MGGNYSAMLDDLYKIAGIGSFLFVAYQAGMFKKDYRIKNERAEREKAIELSRFYQQEIINKITYIWYVFKDCGIEELIGNLKHTDLREFDNQELSELLDKDKQKQIGYKLKNIDVKILVVNSQLLRHKSYDECWSDLSKVNIGLKETYNEAAAGREGEDKNKKHYKYCENKYRVQLNAIINDVLNQLEYFCMNFNSGIADEGTVYQSLHQTFFKIVRLLYFKIAELNISGKDKYYTNIIKLHNIWSKRYLSQTEKEMTLKRKITYEKDCIKR
ncbi:DUF4760 domain-containing protein [Clostridium sp. OS1-26]|uniref:DUF4760 domain-containing protein n=1 Tax=Clostridium sp. OS1-26 TaxID=3070681 RepID=UPI0027DEEFE5|nr:DUF4760 domain-containing protein [Clostridium sp. OS1-26]WML35329.1 DUF4760 domain-containing protein [Clostridium sp. OS1-26]